MTNKTVILLQNGYSFCVSETLDSIETKIELVMAEPLATETEDEKFKMINPFGQPLINTIFCIKNDDEVQEVKGCFNPAHVSVLYQHD